MKILVYIPFLLLFFQCANESFSLPEKEVEDVENVSPNEQQKSSVEEVVSSVSKSVSDETKNDNLSIEYFYKILSDTLKNEIVFIPVSNWRSSYLYANSNASYSPEDTIIRCDSLFHLKAMNNSREIREVVLEHVSVEMAVIQSTNKRNGYFPSFKMYLIRFPLSIEADKNEIPLKEVSKYILATEGIKNPNWLYRHKDSYVIFQTAAVAFESFTKSYIKHFGF